MRAKRMERNVKVNCTSRIHQNILLIRVDTT